MADVPEYGAWLREFAAHSQHPFVRNSEAMVEYLLQLDMKLPSEYGWRVITVDAFKKQAEKAVERAGKIEPAENLNRLYWHDMARSIEAYDVVIVWRAAELVRISLRLLNQWEVLTPAILARSLLELGAAAILDSNTIHKSVKSALANAPDGAAIMSFELEELVVRMLYGTRMDGLPDHPKQINATTYIQKVSKNANASELLPIYVYLCDLTHPNVLGNSRFWASMQSKNEDGSETLRMERYAESATTSQIRENTLWALGWSSVCIRNTFEMAQDTVRRILQRWPR